MTIPGTAPVQLLLRPRDSNAGWARRILVGLVACAAACAVSITFLDRPIAVAVHALIRQPGQRNRPPDRQPDPHARPPYPARVGPAHRDRRDQALAAIAAGTGRRRSGAADPADVVFLASSAVVEGEVTMGVLKYALRAHLAGDMGPSQPVIHPGWCLRLLPLPRRRRLWLVPVRAYRRGLRGRPRCCGGYGPGGGPSMRWRWLSPASDYSG